MVTAKEIAEAAHVSRSTVQRALTGSISISRGTKKRILDIAKTLGYRPNRHARALVMRRQNIAYAAILTIPENSFMQEVLRGITKAGEELKDSGATVSIHFMDTIDGRRQASLIDRLVKEGIKGVVMIPVDCEEVRQAIANGVCKGTNFITLATDIQRSRRLCFVGQDNRRSGRVAGGLMSFLLRGGKRSPASGAPRNSSVTRKGSTAFARDTFKPTTRRIWSPLSRISTAPGFPSGSRGTSCASIPTSGASSSRAPASRGSAGR